jgi:hypothetical protein
MKNKMHNGEFCHNSSISCNMIAQGETKSIHLASHILGRGVLDSRVQAGRGSSYIKGLKVERWEFLRSEWT